MDSGSLKHLWETWDIRVVILLSLFLQVFLIFSAPLRKRMSDWYVSIPIWTAYLCADVAAIYAVRLISRSFILRAQGTVSPDLKVLWASFLLVHLGGPDTITAFAREDNEFWLGHLLSLISQSVLVIYVFCTAFPGNKALLLPAALIFLSGCIKYSERIRCLYYASSDAYRESFLGAPNPGSDYAKLILLVGAIALDLIAFAMVLFSDWTAVALSEPDTGQYIASELIKRTQIKTILQKLLRVDRTRWPREHGTKEVKQKRYSLMKVIRQRWSNTVSQYNLIDCCLRPRPKFMRPDTGFIGLTRILSDHMLYLLIMQTDMMSTVAATGLVRFRDTCSETIRFFSQRNIKKSDRAIACKSILLVETVVKPVAVKEARSKALLFDASMLAKELRKLRKEDKWEIIFRVWVELMCYAASHCRPSAHATELSKGGQLITLVWLLMTHFGLGNQFQMNDQTVTVIPRKLTRVFW